RAWHRAPGRHQPGSGARVGWATCTSALPFDEEAVLAQPLRLGGGREDDAELLAPARLAKFVEALLASRSLGKLVEAGDERRRVDPVGVAAQLGLEPSGAVGDRQPADAPALDAREMGGLELGECAEGMDERLVVRSGVDAFGVADPAPRGGQDPL